MEPLFDSLGFARRLRALMVELTPLSYRDAAAQAGVSAATFSRASTGEPTLSHEAVLRITAWMEAKAQPVRKAG